VNELDSYKKLRLFEIREMISAPELWVGYKFDQMDVKLLCDTIAELTAALEQTIKLEEPLLKGEYDGEAIIIAIIVAKIALEKVKGE